MSLYSAQGRLEKPLCFHSSEIHGNAIDLELRADFDQVSADPDLFLRTNTRAMALEEAQLLPALFPALRVAIDRDRSRMGRFVLTGSSSPALQKSVSESLAGRAAVIDVSPLSFHEVIEEPHQFCKLVNMGASIHELVDQLQYKSTIQMTHVYS